VVGNCNKPGSREFKIKKKARAQPLLIMSAEFSEEASVGNSLIPWRLISTELFLNCLPMALVI
jgi:hypothetical protein